MSSRATFKLHKQAIKILSDFSADRSNGGTKIADFAKACLAASAGSADSLPDIFAHRIRQVTNETALFQPTLAPWEVATEVTMHICERLLGQSNEPEYGMSTSHLSTKAFRTRSHSCGTYSTPSYVADNLVQRVFDELRKQNSSKELPLSIVDLSAEAGHFALTTLRQTNGSKVDFYGVDRDPEAASLNCELLRFGVTNSCNAGFSFHSVICDSFSSQLSSMSFEYFDAVIGNPPWKSSLPIDSEYLRKRYSRFLVANFDIYLAFFLRAYEVLRSGGLLGFVVPSTFLYNENANLVRKFVLENFQVLYLGIYPRRTFIELSSVAPIVIILKKNAERLADRRKTSIEIFPPVSVGRNPVIRKSLLANKRWNNPPRFVFSHTSNVVLSATQLDLDKSATLDELGCFSHGARLNSGRNATTPVSFIGVKGKDLRPFFVNASSAHPFEVGASNFDRTPPIDLIDRPKVIFQTLRCLSLPRRLIAAEGQGGLLSCSTSAMFLPTDSLSVSFFVGFLNSAMANAWYKALDHNKAIKTSVLRNLRVPIEHEIFSRIAETANTVRELQLYLEDQVKHCTIPSVEIAARRNRMSAALEELDNLVFELFEVQKKNRQSIIDISNSRSM